ncbi:MAG: sugar kinase, partial [Aestuariivirga sp.]
MVKSTGEKEQASLANASEILSLIASGAANSRAALLAASGMSRVTVTQRLNVLLGAGLRSPW